jgi:hypothetical protein
MAEQLERDALADLRLMRGFGEQLQVGVRVHIDEAGWEGDRRWQDYVGKCS